MKKAVFVLLAGIGLTLSVQKADAWCDPGHLVHVNGNLYNCVYDNNSYCQQSVEPNDPSPTVGDGVYTKYPDGRVKKGVIVAITKQQDSGGTPSGPGNQVDVQNETGEVDHIVSNN